mmetsp:Transcript_9708/g.27207  ORF Transcript_9708/g.27207 Transcript_9708/m.27207 type:complete len:432 (-) Transcript_9708:11-1306(-)
MIKVHFSKAFTVFFFFHATADLVEDVDAVKVISGLHKTGSHCLLTSAEGHTGVVVLLVGLVICLGVSDLSLEVVVVLGLVLADSVPVGPLSVSVDVHLDDTVTNGLLDLIDGGTGAAVEDELHGLVLIAAELLLDVGLGAFKDLGLEVDVAGGVDAVDVAEGGSAGEGTALNLGELLVGVPDLLGLGVETAGVDVGVINTVLLTTGDAELELEKNANLGELLEVRLADGNVLLEGLLGEVEHVRGEEGLAGLLEVLLGGGKEAVDPGKPGLLAMVGVEDDGDTVERGDLVDMLGGGNGTGDGGAVVGVVEGLAGDELSATLGEGDHDGTAVLGGGLHAGVDGVGADDVDSGDGPASVLGGIEKVDEGITGHDTGLDGGGKLGEGLGIGGGGLKAGGGTEGLLGRGEGGGGANEERCDSELHLGGYKLQTTS